MIKTMKILTILSCFIAMLANANYLKAQDIFKSVKIGKQAWMSENLNVDRFRNGDTIREAKTKKEWEAAGKEGKPVWCYYNYNPVNGKKYGKLYNWYAVIDKRGLAPEGWHVPTKAEFEILASAVHKNGNALKAKGQGKGQGAGTNKSGFSALLAGYCFGSGDFIFLGNLTNFWSSTDSEADGVFNMALTNDSSDINSTAINKEDGISIRCIKN